MHCICKIGEREIEREGEECSTLEVCSKLIILFISLNILAGSPRQMQIIRVCQENDPTYEWRVRAILDHSAG